MRKQFPINWSASGGRAFMIWFAEARPSQQMKKMTALVEWFPHELEVVKFFNDEHTTASG